MRGTSITLPSMQEQLLTWQASLALEIRKEKQQMVTWQGRSSSSGGQSRSHRPWAAWRKRRRGKPSGTLRKSHHLRRCLGMRLAAKQPTLDLDVVALGNLEHVLLLVALDLDLLSLGGLEGELHYA